MAEDPIQRRIEDFLRSTRDGRSLNGSEELWVGTSKGIREHNEDRGVLLTASYPSKPDRNYVLAVVSDGVGGILRGEDAAILAVSAFVATVVRMSSAEPAERVRSGLISSNGAVYDLLRSRGGATLSVVLVTNSGIAALGSVGDSRVYGITNTREVRQLSRNDTLAAYLQERGQHVHDPQHNRLVQYVGMGEGLDPQILRISTDDLDSLLLTTDGIHNSSRDAFTQVLRASVSTEDLVRRLAGF